MRILPLTVVLLLLNALPSTAQVTVEIVVEQAQFLRDEPLEVKVRVTNRSGRTLQLGQDNEWIAFAIESRVNRTVKEPQNEQTVLNNAAALPAPLPQAPVAVWTAHAHADAPALAAGDPADAAG